MTDQIKRIPVTGDNTIDWDTQEQADPTPPPVPITITDDELKANGFMHDTQTDKTGWEDTYLTALTLSHSITDSARVAGISVRRVQERIQKDPPFHELHEQALASVRTALYDAAVHRALHGTPVTYTRKDGTIVEKVEYDNRLLEFVVSKLVPEFQDKRDAQTALEGGIIIKFQIDHGGGKQIPELPAGADVEADAEEITDGTPD